MNRRTQWPLERNEKTAFNTLDEYDRIVGEQCKENKTWRRIAVLGICAFFASLVVLVYALNMPKTVPLVVTVSDWGEAKYVGDISKYSYTGIHVPEIAIQYQLRKFIINLYTIPADATVLKANYKDCYSALTRTSSDKLSKMLQETNPFKDFGSINRTVEIESVLALSQNSYQVDYFVTTERRDASESKKERMRAVMTTKMMEPPKEDQVLNPLGIYITNWDVTTIEGGN